LDLANLGEDYAIVEKTRLGGETVGNGLKTIMARIYQSKSIDPDVSDEDMSKMSAMLSKLGIQVRDTTGAYRPLNDILQEIRTKQEGLTDSQKMAINTQASGIRQANIFANALSTVEKAQTLSNEATNSNGELQNANNKYLDTAQAKWKILGSTMTAMWQNSVSSDGIKGMIDGLTGIVKVFGNLKTIAMAVVTTLLLFKGVGILSFFTALPAKIIGSITSLTLYRNISATVQMQQAGMITTNQALSFSFKALGVSIKTAFLSNPLGWIALGITAIASAFSFASSQAKKLQENNAELLTTSKEATNANNENLKYFQEEGNSYDTLKDKVTLTTAEKQKLQEIQTKIGEQFPQLIKGYDAEGKVIIDKTKNVKDLVEALKEQNTQQQNILLANGGDALKGSQKTISNNNASKVENNTELKKLETGNYTTGHNDAPIYESENITAYTKKVADLTKQQKDGKNVTDELAKATATLKDLEYKRSDILNANSVLESKNKDEMAKITPYISAVISQYEGLNDVQKKFVENSVELTPSDLMKFGEGDFSGLRTAVNEQIKKLSNSKEVVDLDNLIKIENPNPAQIKEYFDLIFSLAKKTGKNPIDLSKLMPLQGDSTEIEKQLKIYLDEVNSKMKKEKDSNKIKALKTQADTINNMIIAVHVEATEVDDAQVKLDKLATAIKALTTTFDTSMDSISSYNKLISQFDEDGSFSAESIKEIIDSHQELAGYLGDEPLLYNKISEAMNASKNTANKAYAEMMASNEAYYTSNIKGTDIIKKALGSYYDELSVDQKNDLENSKTLAESKLIVEKSLISRLASAWDAYNKAVSDVLSKHTELATRAEGNEAGDEHTDALLSRLVGNNKAVQDAYTSAQSIQSQIDKIDTSFSNITANIKAPNIDSYGASVEKATDSTNKLTEADKALTQANKDLAQATKQSKNATDDYDNAMKSLSVQMKLLDSSQSKLEEHSKAYRDGIEKKITLLKQELDITKKSMVVNQANAKILQSLEGTANIASANSVSSKAGQDVVAEAKKYLGTPYVWGGSNTNGFDCSGLVQYVYKQLGVDIGRTTYDQVKQGTSVAKKDLQAGDIVFFGDASSPHHEGMYIGDGKFIQAPKTGDVVKISQLNSRSDYAGARRILSGGSSASKSSTSSSSSSSGSYAGGYANGKYKDWINQAGAKYGIDPNIIAGIIQTESSFDPTQKNASGHVGLGQFSASTAKEVGLTNRTDAQSSINAIAKYLKTRIGWAGGDVNKGIMG